MNNKSPVSFKFGDDSVYKALDNKDGNTIYFTTDDNNNHRIYVGSDCYNVDVVTTLDTSDPTILDNNKVPSVLAVLEAVNQKVNRCQLVTSDDTSLPSPMVLKNNTEYRYLNVTNATNVTINIPQDSTPYLYYSSIVISHVNSSDSISNFVQVDVNSSEKNIVFLNGDVSLSGSDTVELLFFSNGRHVCCIGASYTSEDIDTQSTTPESDEP